ncbi:histidine protein methyltransferase 1 homolog isoform X2 [Agrilus planipennis]|uniref:protein-histidine N-methyltransferase n=1 Tax=Agrilus planipennis TaxID=224129 RepID=A0A1W4XUG7_AGRPL|nr:histidine protein methyltransferase 1 homolog isoform X2 [Agrilus planipennis]
MFKFNFFEDSSACNKNEEKPNCKECEELHVNNFKLPPEYPISILKINDKPNEILIKHVAHDDVINYIKKQGNSDTNLFEAEEQHSDLLSGVYEGGLKVWECTFDLVNFLIEKDINFMSKKVLDLGCGVGIVGIWAILKGATVVFQDYNSEVLKYATIPNVSLNVDSQFLNTTSNCKAKFISGDWTSFVDHFAKENEKFDYILTSETIYNRDNYEKLHKVFKDTLKGDGYVYVAAKSYYFGLGGGVHDFIEFINSQNVFCIQRCWESNSGVKREIILLKFK